MRRGSSDGPAPARGRAACERAGHAACERGSDRGLERGQATVEFVLVLPLLAVLLAVVVQVGLVVRDQVLVVHAAREAARAVAVREKDAGTPQNATRLARQTALAAAGPSLDPDRLTVEVREADGSVNVRLGYRSPIRGPLPNFLRKDVRLAAFAQIHSEID